MFICKFELDNKTYNGVFNSIREYYNCYKDKFSPLCKNIEVLLFKISGKTYREKKASLEELAKDWQIHFSQYNWSYSELAEIEDYFYENGKRYGLLKEFKENCIC